jgi:hypothetical protein
MVHCWHLAFQKGKIEENQGKKTDAYEGDWSDDGFDCRGKHAKGYKDSFEGKEKEPDKRKD